MSRMTATIILVLTLELTANLNPPCSRFSMTCSRRLPNRSFRLNQSQERWESNFTRSRFMLNNLLRHKFLTPIFKNKIPNNWKRSRNPLTKGLHKPKSFRRLNSKTLCPRVHQLSISLFSISKISLQNMKIKCRRLSPKRARRSTNTTVNPSNLTSSNPNRSPWANSNALSAQEPSQSPRASAATLRRPTRSSRKFTKRRKRSEFRGLVRETSCREPRTCWRRESLRSKRGIHSIKRSSRRSRMSWRRKQSEEISLCQNDSIFMM